jgi:hypothetical protein
MSTFPTPSGLTQFGSSASAVMAKTQCGYASGTSHLTRCLLSARSTGAVRSVVIDESSKGVCGVRGQGEHGAEVWWGRKAHDDNHRRHHQKANPPRGTAACYLERQSVSKRGRGLRASGLFHRARRPARVGCLIVASSTGRWAHVRCIISSSSAAPGGFRSTAPVLTLRASEQHPSYLLFIVTGARHGCRTAASFWLLFFLLSLTGRLH